MPMYFTEPRTIRERENLGSLETVAYREKGWWFPSKLYQIYVEDGMAKLSVCDNIYWKFNEFVDLYDVGSAEDVAIEFYGYWEQVSLGYMRRKYNYVTEEEPYLFRRLSDGDLVVQKGKYGEPETLATNVTGKIYAKRGWQNVGVNHWDYGLIIGYIRNGTLFYRTLAEQEDGSVIWEGEREVEAFPDSINDFTIFRATDYRMGIMAEIDGSIYLALTERNWARMGIQDEACLVGLSHLRITLISIEFLSHQEAETIGASIVNQGIKTFRYDDIPILVDIYNPSSDDTETIVIEFNNEIEVFKEQEDAFTVTDEEDNTFTVHSTEQGENANILHLNTECFQLSEGNLTVNYDKEIGELGRTIYYTTPSAFVPVDSFSEEFTPDISTPSRYTSDTIEKISIKDLSVDFLLIDFIDFKSDDESIETNIVDVHIEFTHIDYIDP